MKIYCKNCPKTVRTPMADCWKKLGLCPACADKRKYPEYNDSTMREQPKEPYKKITDVDIYWDTLTIRAVQLGQYP